MWLFAFSLPNVDVPAALAAANGLAASAEPNDDTKGVAVLRLELLPGAAEKPDLLADPAEDANGEAVAPPKEEKGLTNALAAPTEDVLVAAGENEDVGRPKLACTDELFDSRGCAFNTGAAGLGGADTSGVEIKEAPLEAPPPECASESAKGCGVSGGFASVEISESASDGVSKPVDEVDLGKAECKLR